MKKYYLRITLFCLLALSIAIPVYSANEAGRMAAADQAFLDVYVSEGTHLYIKYCADCHGPGGEGADLMPALNNPALADADSRVLFQVIARAAHGTSMAAWHIEEGGTLNDYEVGSLVALIKANDWTQVIALAGTGRTQKQPMAAGENAILYFNSANPTDPHDCIACHDEPALHAESFGINCSYCHTLEAWKPALLTRHTFAIDHGDEGNQTCQTCHVDTYVEYTCYICHDHTPQDMEIFHVEEGYPEYDACIECHPTGAGGEAGDILAGH